MVNTDGENSMNVKDPQTQQYREIRCDANGATLGPEGPRLNWAGLSIICIYGYCNLLAGLPVRLLIQASPRGIQSNLTLKTMVKVSRA